MNTRDKDKQPLVNIYESDFEYFRVVKFVFFLKLLKNCLYASPYYPEVVLPLLKGLRIGIFNEIHRLKNVQTFFHI